MQIEHMSFLINALKDKTDRGHPKFHWFLGAGCSVSSGIPSGWQVTDLLQKMSFDQKNSGIFGNWQYEDRLSYEDCSSVFKDTYPENEGFQAFLDFHQSEIRSRVDQFDLWGIPNLIPPNSDQDTYQAIKELIYGDYSYGYWLEHFSNKDPKKRQMFFEKLIGLHEPKLAYLIFSHLIDKHYVHNVFTTNFDDLVNDALRVYFSRSVRVTAHPELSDYINFESVPPNIIKIHGDPWFNNLRNTLDEVNKVQNKLSLRLQEGLGEGYGLVVIGYNGADYAVMNVLESAKATHYTLIWCDLKEFDDLHWRTKRLLTETENNYYIKIESFEDLMAQVEKLLVLPRIDILDQQMRRQEQLTYLYIESTVLQRVSPSTKEYLNMQYYENDLYLHAFNEKNLHESNRLLQHLIQLCPNHSKAYLKWGFNLTELWKMYKDRRYLEDGIRVLNKVLKIIEEDKTRETAEAYSNISFCLIQFYESEGSTKSIFKALKLLEKAVVLYPKNFDLYNNLGYCYQLLWDKTKQKKYLDLYVANYRICIEKNPHQYYAYNNWSWGLIRLYRMEKKEVYLLDAIKIEEQVIQVNPFHVESICNIAYCHRELFEFDGDRAHLDRSILICEQAIKIFKDYRRAILMKIEGLRRIWEAFKQREALDEVYALATKYADRPTTDGAFRSNIGWYFIMLWEDTHDKAYLYKAIEELQIALKSFETALDRYNLGNCYFDLWKADKEKDMVSKSLRQYRRAVKLDPGSHAAYCNMGNLFFELWKEGKEERDLLLSYRNHKRAVALHQGKKPLYHFNFGLTLMARWRYSHEKRWLFEALKELETGFEMDRGSEKFAINLSSCMLEIFEQGFDNEMIGRAVALLKAYTQEHAVGMAYFNLGKCYEALFRKNFALETLDEAIAAYGKAIEIDPGYIEAIDNQGWCFINKGMNEQNAKFLWDAIGCFSKALDIDPKTDIAWYNWGLSLYHLYELSSQISYLRQACEKFDEATRVNPMYKEAYYYWGLCLEHIGSALKDENCFKSSIERLQRATEIDPFYADAYYSWGYSLMKLFGFSKDSSILLDSIVQNKKAAEVDSSYDNAFLNWGWCLQELFLLGLSADYLDQAMSVYGEAIVVNPSSEKAHYNLGVCHYLKWKQDGNLANLQDAIRYVRQAVQIFPDYGSAYNTLGCYLLLLFRVTGNLLHLQERDWAFELYYVLTGRLPGC